MFSWKNIRVMGTPLTPMKICLKFWGILWKLIWCLFDVYWDSRENLLEIVAVVIMFSPISFVCGVRKDLKHVHVCATSLRVSYLRKRALYLRKKALYFRKRALYTFAHVFASLRMSVRVDVFAPYKNTNKQTKFTQNADNHEGNPSRTNRIVVRDVLYCVAIYMDVLYDKDKASYVRRQSVALRVVRDALPPCKTQTFMKAIRRQECTQYADTKQTTRRQECTHYADTKQTTRRQECGHYVAHELFATVYGFWRRLNAQRRLANHLD